MDKRSQLILLAISLFGIISILFSCERDDLCADSVITPNLIITLVQQEDLDELDPVVDLQIEYLGDDNDRVTVEGDSIEGQDIDRLVFDNATTTDSISLALPTFKDSAVFVFKQNFDENEPMSIDTEIDTITFFYNRTEEYINRACGFRTIYSDLRAEISPEGDNFIRNAFIDIEIVENEEETHVRLSH